MQLLHLATQAQDDTVAALCQELNRSRAVYPGITLYLVYEILPPAPPPMTAWTAESRHSTVTTAGCVRLVSTNQTLARGNAMSWFILTQFYANVLFHTDLCFSIRAYGSHVNPVSSRH